MKRSSIFGVLMIMLLTIVSCNLPDIPFPEGTPDPSVLATLVESQLQTLIPGMQPASTATPDGGGPGPSPTPTENPCQPQPPPAVNNPLPAGIAAAVPDSEVVELINLDGNVLQNRDAAGLVFEEQQYLHVAGPISMGPMALPVVYHALESGGWLKVNVQGAPGQLREAPMLVAIAGAAGGDFMAYSRYDSDVSGWESFLFAGDLNTLPGAAPLLTRAEGDGYVFYPVAIRAPGGQAEGIWYTLTMQGIGNIIYPPNRGLYYLDLATSDITAFLGFDYPFSSLSPDQTWAAYRPGPNQAPGIYLRNLATCEEVHIAPHPSTTLGAGYVVFAPDNSKVAWIEASGDLMGVIDLFVRVANTDGSIVVEAPMANLYGLAGGEELSWIRPVGWVDSNQVLYAMALLDWSGQVIARAEANFHNPIPLAIGSEFLGFYYP